MTAGSWGRPRWRLGAEQAVREPGRRRTGCRGSRGSRPGRRLRCSTGRHCPRPRRWGSARKAADLGEVAALGPAAVALRRSVAVGSPSAPVRAPAAARR